MDTETLIEQTRSVGAAADALLRAIERDGADLEGAVERLEVNARLAVEVTAHGFDAEPEPSGPAVLLSALSQLQIGDTLLAAESAVERRDAGPLRQAARGLDRTADVMEGAAATAPRVHGFDTVRDGRPLTAAEAAYAALDEMSAHAAGVATALAGDVLKPVTDRIPETIRELGGDLLAGVPGRLAGLALRAVRRGLDLLLRVVDRDALRRMSDRLGEVVSRLGEGEDPAVFAGWVIGADHAREQIAGYATTGGEALAAPLAVLADGFRKVCDLLRRVAVVVAGLAAGLAVVQVTLPHAVPVTTAGLLLVLAVLVVLGRDHTGATDLPGPVRGVLRIVRGDGVEPR